MAGCRGVAGEIARAKILQIRAFRGGTRSGAATETAISPPGYRVNEPPWVAKASAAGDGWPGRTPRSLPSPALAPVRRPCARRTRSGHLGNQRGRHGALDWLARQRYRHSCRDAPMGYRKPTPNTSRAAPATTQPGPRQCFQGSPKIKPGQCVEAHNRGDLQASSDGQRDRRHARPATRDRGDKAYDQACTAVMSRHQRLVALVAGKIR
jgi:hypothetical protein